MSINTIIEEEKIPFENKFYLKMSKGVKKEVWDWHIQSTKQILEAEVERLKGIRNTRVHCCQSDEGNQCEYDECLDDQITHLTNIIKEI